MGIKKIKFFRFKDFIAIFFFLFIAVLCIDMYRHDLLQTLSLQNVEPVGTVVIKKNVVQRRISSRVLWDRLSTETPVYIGDVIRVADVSEATLYVGDNTLDLEENTLIRITLSEDGEGVQVSISEGNISVASNPQSKKMTLDVNGKKVVTEPGVVVSASVKENGTRSVQVSKGAVKVIEDDGIAKEIPAGAVFSVDYGGRETREKAVVVTQPAPNTRYLNSTRNPVTVNFAWNRINLEADELLRLDISPDNNFSNISNSVNELNNRAQARVNTGTWYWRICFNNTTLSKGTLTIADGSAVELKNPAANSVFRYSENYPSINFQWTEVEEADSYILEVSSTSNFLNPALYKRTNAAYVADSSLGNGLWYWRVTPVFPPVYSGNAGFSKTGFFRIEQTSAQTIEAAQNLTFTQWLAAESPSSRPPTEVPAEIAAAVVLPLPTAPIVTQAPASLTQSATPAAAPSAVQSAQPEVARPAATQRPAETLLTAPQNLRPARGVTYGFNELQSNRNIVFRWAAVREANAYIFTLYQQTTSGRQQIIRSTVNDGTSYTLNNLSLLDRGNFVWQVEPVVVTRGSIQRRGRTAENNFTVNFPVPRPVEIEDTGTLYGN